MDLRHIDHSILRSSPMLAAVQILFLATIGQFFYLSHEQIGY